MAHGGMQAIVMIILALVYGVIGIAALVGARRPDEQMIGAVFLGMIVVLAVVALVLVLPQVIGGYKLWKERPGARTWGIIGSIISCLSFPLGTAAGVYGLWFLFGDEGKRMYLAGGQQQPMFQEHPPPPASWQ